ncbi:hypothetical protein [Plasmodium yoelii yoelii]|uniref:Uncharacterized protein n=1 Tax=Plasmodium yoelii yoelii TaxID=73239 RepID=Q7RJJ9_PLAYO|nr:hypothetical protein [Plasmodium yoelii yoelii]
MSKYAICQSMQYVKVSNMPKYAICRSMQAKVCNPKYASQSKHIKMLRPKQTRILALAKSITQELHCYDKNNNIQFG